MATTQRSGLMIFAAGGFSVFPLKAIPASGERDLTTWAKDSINLIFINSPVNTAKTKPESQFEYRGSISGIINGYPRTLNNLP